VKAWARSHLDGCADIGFRVVPATGFSVNIADLGGIGVEFSRTGCFALTSV